MKWSREFDLGTYWLILDRAERAMRAAEGGRRRRRPEFLRVADAVPCAPPLRAPARSCRQEGMCRAGAAVLRGPQGSTQQWTLVSWKGTLTR
jgi:hypothetical protein